MIDKKLIDEILKKYKIFMEYKESVYENIQFIENVPIIPIDDILCKIASSDKLDEEVFKCFLPKFFNRKEELRNEIYNFIEEHELTIDEIYSSYIRMIIYLIDNYSIEIIRNILNTVCTLIEKAIFYKFKECKLNLYRLGLMIILIYCKGNIPRKDLIDIGIIFFNIKRNKDFLQYINLIGIDIYKIFLNELYLFILSKPGRLYLWEEFFIRQCLYSKLMEKTKVEKIMKLLADRKYFSISGVKLLESINSSYTEKYKSYLLMEELK